MRAISTLLFAAVACSGGGVCAGCGGGDGDELPDSFRFTVDAASQSAEPCFTLGTAVPQITISDARGAEPIMAGLLFDAPADCVAAVEHDDAWSIACSNARGSAEIRVAKSFDAGEIELNHPSAICARAFPMVTVEVLAP
jgi:hypothetical protein